MITFGASRRTLVGAVVLTLGLGGFGVERGLDWRENSQRQGAGEAAVDAASREVIALVGLSKATSQKDINRLIAGATGDFQAELKSQAATLQAQTKANGVRTTGEINSAGLEKLDGDRHKAVVIVAASGTVANKATKGAEPRRYRFRVELTRKGDNWLVAGMEFVS